MSFRDHWRTVELNLRKRGLYHSTIETYATYSPWLGDKEFTALIQQIADSTLVDVYRLWELSQLAQQVADVPGDVLEVGVWRGGTGAILTSSLPMKKVWLADTFTGIVNESDLDLSYNGGEHSDTSVDVVETLLDSMNLNNYKICKGVFPTETGFLIPGELSFVHIDVDVYESAKQIWDFVISRLSSGGLVVFDDYGFSSTDGVTTFVNEIRKLPGYRFVYNLNGHGIFLKL
jgi:O-methyltransferase